MPTCGKYGKLIRGSELNNYIKEHSLLFNCEKPFSPLKLYGICSNMKKIIDESKSPVPNFPSNPTISCKVVPKSTPSKKKENDPIASSNDMSRYERHFLRNRIPVQNLKGIKSVKVTVADELVEVIDIKNMKKNTLGYKQIYQRDVLCNNNYYRVPFQDLSMKQWRIRMLDLSKKIVSACINRKEFKKDADTYLYQNEDLAI